MWKDLFYNSVPAREVLETLPVSVAIKNGIFSFDSDGIYFMKMNTFNMLKYVFNYFTNQSSLMIK